MEKNKIKCIAVDDEPLALEKMEGYIQRVHYLELIGSFSNPLEAMSFLRQNSADLLFLDIQMDELTGIQLLEILDPKPKVILTTAYDEYALQGYELDVSDYLLKPISFQRFLKGVEKVYQLLYSPPLPKEQKATKSLSAQDYIFIRSEYRLQKVKLLDILYIEGMKDYSRIHTPQSRIMTLQNLKKMEELLPTPPFLRVHKSYIVSLDKIDSIGKNDITIEDKLITLGGLYKDAFFKYLDDKTTLG